MARGQFCITHTLLISYIHASNIIHLLWWEVDSRVIVTSEARSEQNIMMMHRHKMSIIVTSRPAFLSKCVKFKVGQCKTPTQCDCISHLCVSRHKSGIQSRNAAFRQPAVINQKNIKIFAKSAKVAKKSSEFKSFNIYFRTDSITKLHHWHSWAGP